MRALFLSVAFCLGAASAASAASTAVLVEPSARARPLVVDGRVWRCDGVTCTARGEGRSQSAIRECARAARKLGPLAAYERGGVALDRESLDRCNRAARVR